MYFLITAVLTALAVRTAANPAIIVTPISDDLYSVVANITTLDAPELVESWEYLSYSTFTEPVFTDVSHLDNLTKIEMMAALNLGSGTILNSTDDCDGGIESAYAAFVAAETANPGEIDKRYWFISSFFNKGWHISKSNVVKGAALGLLADAIQASSATVIQLTQSAICYPGDGTACLSWTGGSQAIKKAVALQIINNARGAFGADAVSGQETAAIFDSNSNKRSLTKRRGPYNVCVSNRAKHCT